MRSFVMALALVLASTSSYAHQLKSAVSTVLFNERTGNIELMHRFYLHDTEHAVEELFGKQADMLNKQEDQARFATYVAEHIGVKNLDGQALNIKPVGFEIDGKFFWVYQEISMQDEPLKGLQMSQGTLQDLWPSQVNMVNFEGRGKVKTLYFEEGSQWQTVVFK